MNEQYGPSTQENDIAFEIVKQLICDMTGRYVVDAVILSANDREDVNVKVAMFEEWRRIVSQQLYDLKLIENLYEPKSRDEIRDLSLGEILEHRDMYLGRV